MIYTQNINKSAYYCNITFSWGIDCRKAAITVAITGTVLLIGFGMLYS